MKFRVTMKDPDGVYESVRDAAEESVAKVIGIDEDEKKSLAKCRVEKIHTDIRPWFKYGEYLTVEVDTDAGTCVVVKS